MKKFTFIAEYKKGTYISQYESSNLMEALVIWADNLDIQFFTEKVKAKIQEKVRDNFYSPANSSGSSLWYSICSLRKFFGYFLPNISFKCSRA